MSGDSDLIAKVSRALGRSGAPTELDDAPPAIDESLVRLTKPDCDLVQLFIERATQSKALVERVSRATLASAVGAFLGQHRLHSVALSGDQTVQSQGLAASLADEGFAVQQWEELSLDELYAVDCGITGVDLAIAETGTLVIKPTPAHGRGLSLIPMVHVAIVESSQIVADLIDALELLSRDDSNPDVIMITGPSKTGDIEMNVVTGVHGPNLVKIFVLQ